MGYIYNKFNDISWKIECQSDKSLRDELRRIYEKYTPYIYEIKEGLEAWNKDYNQARKRDILYDSEKRQAELSERIILEIKKISPIIDKLSSEIDAYVQKTELEIEEMEHIEQELTPKRDYFSKIDQMKEMSCMFNGCSMPEDFVFNDKFVINDDCIVENMFDDSTKYFEGLFPSEEPNLETDEEEI